MKLYMIFYFFYCSLFSIDAKDSLIVETIYGPVKGNTKKSYNGNSYAAYEGIPFAAPPLGELRFEVIQNYLMNCNN